MKVTFELTEAQVKGAKKYLQALNGGEPTNADVKELFKGEFSALLQMPQSSLATYIMEAEKSFKMKEFKFRFTILTYEDKDKFVTITAEGISRKDAKHDAIQKAVRIYEFDEECAQLSIGGFTVLDKI